jgi:hypothetical protein
VSSVFPIEKNWVLIILVEKMASGRHCRRCNRDWRLSRGGLVSQSAADDSREEVHSVRCFRLEARVSLLFIMPLRP